MPPARESRQTAMKQYSFSKPEHLCLKSDIEALFSAGSHAMTVYPLRAVCRRVSHTSGPQVQVLLSVAKRRLHHAVDRNRAKRQLREAYRRNKHVLLGALPPGVGLHVAFVWLSERPEPSHKVEARVVTLLGRMREYVSSSAVPAAAAED